MPDGVMKWFDEKTGEAEVVRGGRLFPARVGDVDATARHAGARVHFDIRRVHGVERAVDVQLRGGTRVSHHQHRFGTLAGAKSIDAKGSASYAKVHPELRSAEGHPLEVARAWATSVAHGDTAGAACLYSPDALVHVPDGLVEGRSALEAWLAACPVFGSERHARIEGGNGEVVVRWDTVRADAPGMAVSCRIAHAEIAEQWVSSPEQPEGWLREGGTRPLQVSVSTRGEVGASAKAGAERAILRVIESLDEPVLFGRLKLAWQPDPANPRPATAQVTIDLNGDLVRAHVSAHTMPEVIDFLDRRLRDRLEHRAQHREHLRRTGATQGPGEWRHGGVPTPRPAYFDRQGEARELVRHKTFAVDELTPDEAIFDMEQLDYDFYLFRDLGSGSDSIVARLEDGAYRLTRVRPSEIDLGPTAMPVDVSQMPAPTLTVSEATERLNMTGDVHVFFVNAATDRGNVLYRRYDGHYGLITPD